MDKNNNELLNVNRDFNIVDDYTTSSKFNKDSFLNKFDSFFIDIEKKDKQENLTKSSLLLNIQLEDLLKQLPGDILFNLGVYDVILTIVGFDGAFASSTNVIGISLELINNPFVLAHELGHIIAREKNIYNNEELKNIYEEEKNDVLNSQNSEIILELDYFLDFESGLKETAAESYAIISGLGRDTDSFGLRSLLLMQHFPRTIAKVAELI